MPAIFIGSIFFAYWVRLE